VHPSGRHRRVDHLLVNGGGVPLLRRERGHHAQPGLDAVGEQVSDAGVQGVVDLVGRLLRAPSRGCGGCL
jgi:hypothetical protein